MGLANISYYECPNSSGIFIPASGAHEVPTRESNVGSIRMSERFTIVNHRGFLVLLIYGKVNMYRAETYLLVSKSERVPEGDKSVMVRSPRRLCDNEICA